MSDLPTKRQAQRFVEYVEANGKVVFLADNPILELARLWWGSQLVRVDGPIYRLVKERPPDDVRYMEHWNMGILTFLVEIGDEQ